MFDEYIDPNTGEIKRIWKELSYKAPSRAFPVSEIKDAESLRKYCSDNSRSPRGDSGYLVDFLCMNLITPAEMKVIDCLCKYNEVHNFCITTNEDVALATNLHIKTVRRTIKLLEDKNLATVITYHFMIEDSITTLYRVHPKIAFKGSYYKHKILCEDCEED